MYDLTQNRPAPLVPRELRFTVRERMGPDGVIEPLDEESLATVISALQEADVEAIAVCLLFSFMHPVPAGELAAQAEEFHGAHEQRYGFRIEGEEIELVNLRLVASLGIDRPRLRELSASGELAVRPRRANLGGDWVAVDVVDRQSLGFGSTVEGPAIVEFSEATCLVRTGWTGSVDEAGTLILRRT